MSLIYGEEARTKQHAIEVRISKNIANGLAAMNANDWEEADLPSTAFVNREKYQRLERNFSDKGGAAANGLTVNRFKLTLEVSEDLHAPAVEIVAGTPNETPI